jgi:hypothetical protein
MRFFQSELLLASRMLWMSLNSAGNCATLGGFFFGGGGSARSVRSYFYSFLAEEQSLLMLLIDSWRKVFLAGERVA